jgi:alkylation response protein AidB-like acyl-CoA dehydrogenase
MDSTALVEHFDRMLAAISGPDQLRALERGESSVPLWSQLSESGFLDAMVSQESGGAGLFLDEVETLFECLGAHAMPLPVAETMVARRLLAAAGLTAPEGPIGFVTSPAPSCIMPFGLLAEYGLVDTGSGLCLVPMEELAPEPTGVRGDFSARLAFSGTARGTRLPAPDHGLRPMAAVLRAALIAGLSAHVLDMTIVHANQRAQFGKPIGRQQAVQQQMAVMAQHVVAARMAAQLGCVREPEVCPSRAALAKSTTSEAAIEVIAIAHAIHGAIGISEEFDLQLLTRRLQSWRLADGSSSYWNRILGRTRLEARQDSVAWLRTQAFCVP